MSLVSDQCGDLKIARLFVLTFCCLLFVSLVWWVGWFIVLMKGVESFFFLYSNHNHRVPFYLFCVPKSCRHFLSLFTKNAHKPRHYVHLPYHLGLAGLWDDMASLLLDAEWIDGCVQDCRKNGIGVGQVVDRYSALPLSSEEGKVRDAVLVRGALALSASQIANGDASAWSFQVRGRLLGVADEETHPHLEKLVAALCPEGRGKKKYARAKPSRPSRASNLPLQDCSGSEKIEGDGDTLHLSPFELMHPSMTSPGGPLLQTLIGTHTLWLFFSSGALFVHH